MVPNPIPASSRARLARLVFVALFLLGCGSVHSTPKQWDGWYGGLTLEQGNSKLNGTYAHQKYPSPCVNLNFGSEWPGDNCEGNQDYNSTLQAQKTSNSLGISAERLWQQNGYVYGLHLSAQGGAGRVLSEQRVLSLTWGDTLDLRVRLKESLGARFIFGFSETDWLPYITTGVVLQKASVGYVQDQVGYNVPASKSKEAWVFGTTIGMGLKKQLDSDWLFTSEYLLQSLNNTSLTGPAAMHAYGLRYPETQVRFNTQSRILRFGFSRKF